MGKEEWEASYGKEGEALYRERGEALYGKGIGGGGLRVGETAVFRSVFQHETRNRTSTSIGILLYISLI